MNLRVKLMEKDTEVYRNRITRASVNIRRMGRRYTRWEYDETTCETRNGGERKKKTTTQLERGW